MGGKGGALSVWIKEFTSLVFTQTLQAFIYAIVISIILFGMNTVSDVNADDNNSALGLMATFALLSVFKVEELAKKIADTKAKPGNAMKSIAKTAIAAKLGKRVLDNAGKVFGGIGAITKSRQDRKKLNKRLQEDMEDNGFIKDKDGKVTYVKGKKVSGGAGPKATSASSNASGNGGSSDAENEVNEAVNNATNGMDATYKAEISAADQRRIRNAMRTYEDKISEINKARNEGIKNIFKGSTEFIGSGFGAAAGGVFGGADGNLDEMLQGIMAGAGVGDALGESAVNAVDKAIGFVQRNYKRERGMSNKQLQDSLKAYKKAVDAAVVNYNIINVDDI